MHKRNVVVLLNRWYILCTPCAILFGYAIYKHWFRNQNKSPLMFLWRLISCIPVRNNRKDKECKDTKEPQPRNSGPTEEHQNEPTQPGETKVVPHKHLTPANPHSEPIQYQQTESKGEEEPQQTQQNLHAQEEEQEREQGTESNGVSNPEVHQPQWQSQESSSISTQLLPSPTAPLLVDAPIVEENIGKKRKDVEEQEDQERGQARRKRKGARRDSSKKADDVPRPLVLPNVGLTCYLNSGLQVLYCAQRKWGGQGKVTGLLDSLFNKRMRIDDFVSCVEPYLNVGNLRTSSDTRKTICAILSKVAAEDAGVLARLEFTKLTKRFTCHHCGNQQTVNPRGPPNAYFRYLEGDSRNMAERVDASFNRTRDCFDCACEDEDIREQQEELVYFEKYPAVAILCTMSPPAVQIEPTITLGEMDYELLGYALSLNGHAVAVVKHSQNWYYCDDSYISEINGGIKAAIEVADRNGEPVLFAYKQIKAK
eukprot:Phypoly_transcript_01409.p2 GENE.Phypoly_transcript_01409~~Phypoly_transcript_01409.p2  ORF type:complete len:482 (-),score=64.79 Phypoly_transcript_01409:134-1579(-)